MRFLSLTKSGRQAARNLLLISGLTLAAMGCGPAAQEAQIDESVPVEDPMNVSTDLGESAPAE